MSKADNDKKASNKTDKIQHKKVKAPNGGQFKKDNPIGNETRFCGGNDAASKYKDEYCDIIVQYFCEPPREVIYKRSFYQNGNLKSEEPIILPPNFPTFELFAASIGVTAGTLLNWRKDYPRFANAYAQAKNNKLGIIMKNATEKHYDGNFAKFLMVNEYEYKDKQDVNASVVNTYDEETRNMIKKAYERLENKS